jgi:integrase
MREAEAKRDALVARGKSEKVHGPRLDDCVEKYLASRERDIDAKTHDQYRTLLDRLAKFCSARGVYFMEELTVDLLEDFKIALPGMTKKGNVKTTTLSKSVEKLKTFLTDARRREWIKEGLVDRLTGVRAVYEQKEPFTDEEVGKILEGALALKGGTHGYAKHPETFRAVIDLMLETGMRVGDAVRFDPSKLVKGDSMWVYTFHPLKTPEKVLEAFLTNRLKKAIEECAWLSPAAPFAYGDYSNSSYLGNEVYERMKSVGKRVGVDDCRPHRLRDTFAVRMLLKGVSIEDVSRLLGHSSVKVTETYYAKWTTARKRRLEGVVAAVQVSVKRVKAAAKGGRGRKSEVARRV